MVLLAVLCSRLSTGKYILQWNLGGLYVNVGGVERHNCVGYRLDFQMMKSSGFEVLCVPSPFSYLLLDLQYRADSLCHGGDEGPDNWKTYSEAEEG